MDSPELIVKLKEFVLKNRSGKAFRDYTEEQVEAELLAAYTRTNLAYTMDWHDNITSVCTAEVKADDILHIRNILTTKKDNLICLVVYAINNFPCMTLTGFSKGGLKQFNLPRLYKKLYSKK